jgi:dipeptidyl aminopeptidase/acylaminoacyl peptidase
LIYPDDPAHEPLRIDTDLPAVDNIRHDPAWSPDSRKLAYLKGNDLHLYSLADKQNRTVPLLNDPVADQRFLLCSPDGSRLLVKHGVRLSAVDEHGSVIPLHLPAGKHIRGIVRRGDRDVFHSPDGNCCILWTEDSSTGNHGFYRVPLDGGESGQRMEEAESYRGTTFSSTGGLFSDVSEDGRRIVFAAEHCFQPMELWAVDADFSNKRQITAINPDMRLQAVGTERLTAWKDSGGQERKGILVIPAPGHGESRYPLVVLVYPNIRNSHFAHTWDLQVASAIVPPQWLAANGYAVYIPDIYVDTLHFMDGIVRELTLALEPLQSFHEIDMNRKAVMGHSFGGYTVNCIVTQTDMFRAAVSSAGLGDLISGYAAFHDDEGGIDGYGCQWLETGQMKQGGPPWEQADSYVRNSPVFYLNRVATPLLLIGGSEDPLYKPEGMLVGLKRLEKEVNCIVYKGEGHTPRDWTPANRIDVSERVIGWLRAHM